VRRFRSSSGLLSLLLALSLVAAACGDDDDSSSDTGGPETTLAEVDKGGTLVLGAEQELDCADWIASCAGASWGNWVLGAYTMPRALDFDPATGTKVPSNILTEAPTLETDPKQVVTYKLNPEAVWSDGTPITSADFKYTWEQIATGQDIYDTTGYKDIEGVDATDPATAIVTFSKPYAGWEDLFGGFYGIYPSHLLTGKDRSAEMKDGYKWSGGPWMLDHWTKGEEVKLIPNPNYWGTKPSLDAVVFKFVAETAAEVQAYKTGQVRMIYPQAQLELTQLQGLPDTEFDVTTSLNYEALWFNAAKPPLDDINVRQALAYATDRTAIVKQLFGPVQADIEPIQSFMTPANKEWYTDPYKIYDKDLAKVDELLTDSGYAKGGDGIYAKGGQKLSLEISSTAGNKRRELTEQILQAQWKEAGIDLKFNNTQAATLFGEWGPQGVFQIALFAQVPPSTDPGICSTFCSENIPKPPENSGQNWTRTNDPKVDAAFAGVDTELDKAKRKELVADGHKALADGVHSLPIDPFPDIIVWNTAVIQGPVEHNVVYGPFYNMHLWGCKGGQC
jgi:peptide/nickel transport system substrate-binding protein